MLVHQQTIFLPTYLLQRDILAVQCNKVISHFMTAPQFVERDNGGSTYIYGEYFPASSGKTRHMVRCELIKNYNGIYIGEPVESYRHNQCAFGGTTLDTHDSFPCKCVAFHLHPFQIHVYHKNAFQSNCIYSSMSWNAMTWFGAPGSQQNDI